jgi:acyl-CoA synthetase (AMP-forming)/AMP-acid ligase II
VNIVDGARVLVRTGLVRIEPPGVFARTVRASRRWDRTPAGAVAINAVRHGDRIALIDDEGALTHVELHERTNRLANSFAADFGIGEGDRVGLLARDHRGFVETLVALSKLGADVLLLNTSFSGPQLRETLAREGAVALVHDAEFTAPDGVVVGIVADELVHGDDAREPDPPSEPGRQVLLTSGTTGTPKGAQRPPAPLGAILGYLSRVPLRGREPLMVASPMFHAWGFAHMGLGLLLGAPIVIRRRFDPEATLAAIASHRVPAIALVPVMAQRIMELPAEVRARYDTSCLRVAVFGGSAIPGDLAVQFMDAFGDVVYNGYGSTEVALASVASPADLRADPSTAGRLLPGITVKLLDDSGAEVPRGSVGRIFVGGDAQFEGYTDGTGKAMVGGLMSSGDVGRFDSAGRLSIEGRDDDMIVSGGENVFPHEVEDVISDLPSVREAAVIGVPDDDFGQRLRAFVVLGEGGALSEDDIRSAVRSELARYKVPRDVVFVSELPRTSTGKVLKRELAERRVSSTGG